MAQNADNIHVGPGRIFIGTIQPVTGLPPTRAAHTSGVPSTPQVSFVEVGYTEGESVFEYTATYEDINAEQSFGIVATYPTAQAATLTFNAQERTYDTLKFAFDAIGTAQVTTPNADLFYAGGPFAVQSRVVILTSPRRDNPAKFEVLTIYKGQSVQGVRISYSRTAPSRYQVNVRAVHDATRSIGDQLFQWFRET